MVQKIKNFLFRNTTTRQTVAKNTFWLSVSQIGGRLLRAIIIIYAARVLGAEEWGVFNYAITLVAFLTIFVDPGTSNILIREAAKNNDEVHRKKFLSTSLAIRLALVTLAVIVVLFIAPNFTRIEAAKNLLPIVVFVLIFDSLREFGFSYIQAREKMEWEAGLFLITNLAIVGFGFTFLKLMPDVRSFTYAYAAGTGVGMLCTAIVLRKEIMGSLRYFTPSLIRTIFISAWPFAVSSILGMLLLNTDIIIIGWLRTALDLGYYSAAQRLIVVIYLLPHILSSSALPAFARMARVDNEKFRRVFEGIVSMVFLAAAPIIIGGIIVAPALVSFIFGTSYLPGTVPFQILLVTLAFNFPAVIFGSAIFAYDQQKKLVIYSAIGGLLNLILDLALIAPFGIIGCAVATLIAQAVSNAYLWHTMKKINNFAILKHLKKVLVATLVMGITTWFFTRVGLHVVSVITLAIPVYFGLLYVMREKLLREIKSVLTVASE
jgi:O-antigen/teichoic acid export membrane protein